MGFTSTPLQSLLSPATDFWHTLCMTQRLQTLPYNYWPTEKNFICSSVNTLFFSDLSMCLSLAILKQLGGLGNLSYFLKGSLFSRLGSPLEAFSYCL